MPSHNDYLQFQILSFSVELELAHNSYQFILYPSEIGHVGCLVDLRQGMQGKHGISVVVEISLDINLVALAMETLEKRNPRIIFHSQKKSSIFALQL